MKRGIGIIAALTALLAALALLAVTQEEPAERHPEISLEFLVETGQHAERLQCWESPEGEYVVFLPGYASLKNIEICPPKGDVCTCIDGVQITSLNSLDHFELNTPYPLEWITGGTAVHSTISFVQSGDLPTLYIDVASGSMAYIHMDKTHEESGALRLYGADGALLHAGAVAELKGRGDTSWTAEKKPYNLTLAQPENLLDMGTAQRWILLSEGVNPTNIRNKLVYDFAARMGLPYSPDCQWVNLYLNGEYAGLYLLSERNEVHPERVAIPEEGSFLISMEDRDYLDRQKIAYLDLDSEQVLRIQYAGMDNQTMLEIWRGLKNALLSEDGVDPERGTSWQDMIDLDSWARKYLIEEVFANADGGVVSQFFYYSGADPEGRIYAGPVWDYDYAMGGEDYWMRDYPSFLLMNREYADGGHYLPWFYELYREDVFYARLTELYKTEMMPLLEELLESGFDAYVQTALPSLCTDGLRWGYSAEEISEDLKFIRDFLENRMDFLRELWVNGTAYHLVSADPERYSTGYFAVRDGETLPVLPDDDGLGWYNADTGEPFDITQPIYEDVRIVQKKPESALPVIHYLPGLALVLALPGLYLLDRFRTKKDGRRRRDAAKASEISP